MRAGGEPRAARSVDDTPCSPASMLRPILFFALAACIALPATAQTPTTPGPAGAVAAVEALLAAEKAADWPAVLALVDPALVAATAEEFQVYGRQARRTLADSAAVVVSDDFIALRMDPAGFAVVRRVAAAVPPPTGRSPEAVILGLFAVAKSPDILQAVDEMTVRVLGTVALADTLVLVVARVGGGGSPAVEAALGQIRGALGSSDDPDAGTDVQSTAVRWTGGRWAVTDVGETGSNILDRALDVGGLGPFHALSGVARGLAIDAGTATADTF